MNDYRHLNGKRVLVAMSGGVDSSMVAIMLKKAGADVIGLTFKLGDTKIKLGVALDSSCCTIDDAHDALSIAVLYDFPHHVIDLKPEFEKHVIDDFVDKSIDGLTPNPCIVCNKMVKWASMRKYAKMLNCEYVATGHYAKIKQLDGRYYLSKPKDLTKDQTYFLAGLGQDDLAKTVFPLGDYLKSEVKAMVLNEGITTFADKKESFDICFVGDLTYKDFILAKHPQLSKLDGGDIVLQNGFVVGKHSGYLFYTVGQRKGLNITTRQTNQPPLYILHIDAKNNRLVVGEAHELNTLAIWLHSLNFLKLSEIPLGVDYNVKVRSMSNGVIGQVVHIDYEKHTATISFVGELKGGTPSGQLAVIYDGDDVVCSGLIT